MSSLCAIAQCVVGAELTDGDSVGSWGVTGQCSLLGSDSSLPGPHSGTCASYLASLPVVLPWQRKRPRAATGYRSVKLTEATL